MTGLTLRDLLCNRLKTPLGFYLGDAPRFSWIVDAAPGTRIIKTRVECALDNSFADLVFDSARADGDEPDSLCYAPELRLRPSTRYFWRVTVTAASGESASAESWFETARQGEPWAAVWITPDFDRSWHPVLFTDFTLQKPVRSARVSVCGLGVYELLLNGEKAGDECLSPGLCAYDKWLPYQTYDVTPLLQNGTNRIEAELGNGWYKGRYGISKGRSFHYGEEFALLCELCVTYEDGTRQVIASGTDWRARRSRVASSGIFDGEARDDTLDCAAVYPVRTVAMDSALLEPRRSPPVKIMHQIKPVAVITTPAGETVLDMGQNMVGWLEFACKAKKGEEVHLQFGEVLQGGNFYRDNLRTALAEYRYVSDGVKKTLRQQFTFYGFRYVKLTSWHQPVCLEDFTGLVLYSDMQKTGSVTTQNAKVNRLIENTLWGQRGNFLDVPTDCPQRDERMGWTGDAQVFFGTAAFNMDVAAFFDKFCYDLAKEQEALCGAVPVVIPKHDVHQTGACAWGDAATIIPWNHYIRYGDREFLKRQYPSMKAWVEYIRRKDRAAGDIRLWRGDFHYGDWLSLDGEDPIGNRFGGTERTYLASCFYRHSSRLVSKAARALGYDGEAEEYERLSEEVRAAILREYVTGSGRLAVTTQTAYVLALHFDILPEEWREQAAYSLQLKLKESGYHLRTGFVGTPYLCPVLSATGSNNISYRLLLQEDFPSWLYQVNMGATTIWERWNSILPDGTISDTGMNSLNHYSYGSIVEWLYRFAAGINPMEEYPGFRHFRLAPKPDPLLGGAEASYRSASGEIKSSWRYREDGELELAFTVPFGTTAALTLPEHPDLGELRLEAGEHTFRYMPVSAQRLRYDLDTPIREIYENTAAAEALQRVLPDLTGMMLFTMMAGERSINDFIREGFLTLTGEQALELSKKMTEAAQ